MSDSCLEHHPLLCDDFSEEDYSPRYKRYHRHMGLRGRARNNLKGAAAIISRWPDHWSSLLAYMWMGLMMIALTTFILYNSLFAYAITPTSNVKPAQSKMKLGNVDKLPVENHLPQVFMHVLVDDTGEIDLNTYLPYIQIISNKYNEFKYHFVIVQNDTLTDGRRLDDDENNDIALNSLWNKNKIYKRDLNANIEVEYMSLTNFMNNSPIKKYWRDLSREFVEFFIRAISVWEKGGISFNPTILTPRSPHATYIEKIQKVLDKYNKTKNEVLSALITTNIVKTKKSASKTPKFRQKVNNIRDIIDALESDNDLSLSSEEVLSEAENRFSPLITHFKNNFISSSEMENKKSNISEHTANDKLSDKTISTQPMKSNKNSTKSNLLPMFLDFLFHNLPHNNSTDSKKTSTKPAMIKTGTEKARTINPLLVNSSEASYKHITDSYKPMIISTKFVYDEINKTDKLHEITRSDTNDKKANQLTIDLKGNIIATKSSCHAFIGTLFSNVVHHKSDVSLTNFIIMELSSFCKGILSSCMGIDLILI